ncbi:MAG: hypothetical protein IJ752_00960 [Alphaproteobacteria bacterium]|nr:hypothetical protein [Alphaproteobacteria bacterium]
MLTFLTGAAIVVLFAVRPFIYKPASRLFSPEVSSYFTAAWCLVFALPTIPFCKQYLFIDDKLVFLTPGIIFPLLKGVSLYAFMKFNQLVNKENTSGSVFWGVINLALVTLLTTFVFHVPLEQRKLYIILFIGALGALFFSFGEGRRLTAQGKKAFAGTVFFAVLNNLCDVFSMQYTNWYVLYMVPAVGMLLCSIVTIGKKVHLKDFFTTRHFVAAGALYAAGEMVFIFSMQSFFPVIVAIFLVRVAQASDLILAYHIEKEGKAGIQYFFAICIIVLAYFFFFGV